MGRAPFALAFAVAGYVVGAVAGYVLVLALSSNVHDRDVEAAMTGAFFVGPAVALLSALIGSWLAGRARRLSSADRRGRNSRP